MTNQRATQPRLLLLAHSCHPEIGSEPGIGWNRAVQAAKHFPTWMLCDESYNRAAIERHLSQFGPIDNLQFVFVPPSRWETLLRRLPGTFYLAYYLWHRRAYRIARHLHDRWQFDLVHQANLCGFREPGFLWKLDVPFVWGPVGGAQNYPWRFLTCAGVAAALKETVRSVLNTCQMRFAPRVGQAARQAAAFLTANRANAKALARRRGSLPDAMVEVGMHLHPDLPPRSFRHDRPLRLLWSGVFEHRKALHLLLRALAALPPRVKYELHILGRGPLERRWRRMATRLKVEQHCRWLGWLDRDSALQEYLSADLFMFTSLRDTTGTVVLEALSAGTPVVCLNHQGAGEIITPQCGRKIPLTTPREVIAGLSDAVSHFHDHREELAFLSRGALARAEPYCWDQQGERMAAIYRSVLEKSGNTRQPAPDIGAVSWPDSLESDRFASAVVSGLADVDEAALPIIAGRK